MNIYIRAPFIMFSAARSDKCRKAAKLPMHPQGRRQSSSHKPSLYKPKLVESHMINIKETLFFFMKIHAPAIDSSRTATIKNSDLKEMRKIGSLVTRTLAGPNAERSLPMAVRMRIIETLSTKPRCHESSDELRPLVARLLAVPSKTRLFASWAIQNKPYKDGTAAIVPPEAPSTSANRLGKQRPYCRSLAKVGPSQCRSFCMY